MKKTRPLAPAHLAIVIGAVFFSFTNSSRAQKPLVAIHDSELTRALESMPASGLTPGGTGTTGYQWWPTNWHYFVMPDSLKEMLRSDGTAFAVVSDANITSGSLLNSNGTPAFPIVISLAAEAMRDDEIAPLTNYVAAGGFLVVGSSSFTRNTNGTSRGDFAIANQMGLHMVNSSLDNWAFNSTFTRVSGHALVAHIPEGTLLWQLPAAADEICWPEANHVGSPPTGLEHPLWLVRISGATVIAQADVTPYLAVKKYGKGYFIYVAAMQPVLGHGGWAPGMYAYGIFRNAIRWAFDSAAMPVPKLSPWPFAYDAAIIFRHDMEALPDYINSIENSAQFEFLHGARGDYYFCTGELRENMPNMAGTIASLQRAVSNYGASIGPHNGGLTNINPYNPALTSNSYDYWHWGPDEVLDLNPPGYANGAEYALVSLWMSLDDIHTWIPGTNNGGGLISWVAPYFNSSREGSLLIQEQLGIQIAGDQKLGPFPQWTLSSQTPGKRYTFASLPVSDWYLQSVLAQSMENGHSIASIHALVDFYYDWGALINLYSHSSSDGSGGAGMLASEYVIYGQSKPRIWSANAASIYNWWLLGRTAQVIPTFTRNGNQSITTLAISGSGSTNTAIEIQAPSASYYGLQVFTNGVAAGAANYRTNGRVIKLLVGTTVTNAQIKYLLPPLGQADFYLAQQGTPMTVPAAGVLGNDTAAGGGGTLSASMMSGPVQGSLNLNGNGSFTYTPSNTFIGVDKFMYRANEGATNSVATPVTLMTRPPGAFFFDNFIRSNSSGSLAPWSQQLGAWKITNGVLTGTAGNNVYCDAFYADDTWKDYFVLADVQFSSTNALGGGIGGRLNPLTGSHYAAWIYPEGSVGGSKVLKLIKFEGWTTWHNVPMGQANLAAVGTNWHTLKLTFQGSNIMVDCDGIQMLNVIDSNFDGVAPYTNGGIICGLYSDPAGTSMTVRNASAWVLSLPPVIQSIRITNAAAVITWSTIPTRNYRLQFKPGLSSTWSNAVPDVLAAGPTASATNVLGVGLQKYFRVVLLP